ncbi:MAG: hypothetical protein ABRQ38_06790 [Candidatus Eremiobacterota bacterium]
MFLKLQICMTMILFLAISAICIQSVNAASNPGVAGKWQSDWGTVTLKHKAIVDNKKVSVTGFWEQGKDKIGQIKGGTFNPSTSTLTFSYYQSWNNVYGTATFTLSSNGKILSGEWVQDNGNSGEWTLIRSNI